MSVSPSLVSLKLVLDELGVDASIRTLADRKRVQKSVYLAQAVGVDLGYSFGWYLKGPYSRRLTRDYFALDEVLSAEPSDFPARRLTGHVKGLLGGLKPILEPPEPVDLDGPSWLELLASLVYLRTERHLNESQAEAIIASEKRALHPFVRDARQALTQAHLLV